MAALGRSIKGRIVERRPAASQSSSREARGKLEMESKGGRNSGQVCRVPGSQAEESLARFGQELKQAAIRCDKNDSNS